MQAVIPVPTQEENMSWSHFWSAAAVCFLLCSPANAVQIKVSGDMNQFFAYHNNTLKKDSTQQLSRDGSEYHFRAHTRVRLHLRMIMSENLSAFVRFQVGRYNWGEHGVGGPGNQVVARLAYLDWNVPSTDIHVRMGRQEYGMPSYTFLYPVVGECMDALVIGMPLSDTTRLNALWTRTASNVAAYGIEYRPDTDADFFALTATTQGENFKISPWGMMGSVGKNSKHSDGAGNMGLIGSRTFPADASNHMLAWWAGIGGELTLFDPFRLTADFIWSTNNAHGETRRSGWYAALGASMRGAAGTPYIRGWYGSGDKGDTRASGKLMNLYGATQFDASNLYYYGQYWSAQSIANKDVGGAWGVQIGLKDVSFLPNVTHDFNVTYAHGTNNTERGPHGSIPSWEAVGRGPAYYLTTADSIVDMSVYTKVKLYKNLTINWVMAYLFTDFDTDVWGDGYAKNAFRGVMNFTYTF